MREVYEVRKVIKFLDTVGFQLYTFLFYFRKIYIVFKKNTIRVTNTLKCVFTEKHLFTFVLM